jgi:Domain of unknown function (DUF4375)
VWDIEAQVNNGGFHQYVWNSTGRFAPQAPEALRSIGAQAIAGITDRALAALGPAVAWHDDDARRALLDDGVAETLEALSDAFLAYPDDLTALLYGFVLSRRTEIAVRLDF